MKAIPAFTNLRFTSPSPSASAEVRLTGAETFKMTEQTRGRRIEVIEGLLWVTQAGDPADYVLGAGETFAAAGRGRIVAQTLTPFSRFTFTPARR